MKILIAYDGSGCSEAALDDLVRAGSPEASEALVMSVAGVWLPTLDGTGSEIGSLDRQTEGSLRKHDEKDTRGLAEAATLASHAKKRVQSMFPRWRVTAESTYGSPASEILTKADEFRPDLIVVGSNGRSAISRTFLGSISQKVLTEAHCSVRVARGRIEVDPTPLRIIIGFDGSEGAHAAVDAVAARPLREYSEVRLVTALSDVTPPAIERFISQAAPLVQELSKSESEKMERLAANPLIKLSSNTVSASLHLKPGNPRGVLVEEAARWNADCIFVGANARGGRMERFLLGSTSAAVAARAHCSVEVVRYQS